MPVSKKRERDGNTNDAQIDEFNDVPSPKTSASSSGPGGTSSNFRNVSACNRCRHRKNRCDQQLPRCTACVKADAKCVGFDPVSKREIPRSYVYFLETRLRNLEALLAEHHIPVPPPEEHFPISEDIRPGVNVPYPILEDESKPARTTAQDVKRENVLDPALRGHDGRGRLAGRVAARPQDLRRTLPQTTMQPPGISFSKVVFAAVRSSVSQTASEKGGRSSKRPSVDASNNNPAQDSFFGLYTKPNVKAAPFPDRELGLYLVDLYFEHANPQIPILHRGEFLELFERMYAKPDNARSSRECYLLKIVFAIGSGIIMDSSGLKRVTTEGEAPDKKRQRLSHQHQHQPEEYHASAVTHLESFLHTSTAMEGHAGGMEELQAVLLLAALALLRPVAPGLWYIIGVAVRLAVDLGLHFEEADTELDTVEARGGLPTTVALGRRQWKRDLRRRLWWCVYSFDRLVSTCVGRPFGITDQVVTTEFPSILSDEYITKDGFTASPASITGPSYKLVAHHYIRLRLLQSEILQVLQYRQAQRVRASSAVAGNAYMHTTLTSPFLDRFHTFREWRADVDKRLGEWRDSAPSQNDIGVRFQPLFLELNYWQAIIMLYRQSLAVPAPLAEELSATIGEEVQSPGTVNQELQQDEQQVFLKVAQAGSMTIKTYRQLHRMKLVNYTFLATHHLFMSGISFLYALWHSPHVRLQMKFDDVDFVILAATSILTDLIDKCPPAEACRDAFQRMSKATISMCMSTTGFGPATTLGSAPVETPGSVSASPVAGLDMGYFDTVCNSPKHTSLIRVASQRHQHPFDMNLQGLLGTEELAHRPVNVSPTTIHESGSPQGAILPQLVDEKHMPSYNTAQSVHSELSWDNMEVFDAATADDSMQQSWINGYLDLGFGTGGTAGSNGVTAWDGSDIMVGGSTGVDMFDGFFFGNGNPL